MKNQIPTETKQIQYFEGVKYVLAKPFWYKTPFIGYEHKHVFVEIRPDGWLHVKAGWAWDGASGPTIDTKSSMRASLAHDAIAFLMRRGVIPWQEWPNNDEMLMDICIKDHMWGWRARLWRAALKLVHGSYGKPENMRKAKVAP